MNLITLHLTIPSDGIATLLFDMPGEKANILSSMVMKELDTVLDVAARDPKIKVLLITSAKKDIFIAGADINEILHLSKGEEAEDKSAGGQEVLSKLEKLPFPTIAVIDGACLGGGLELALAATFRIVSDNPKTKLALPEVTLGIVPGFGGTVRLPRLIGLTESLGMILTGKSVSGSKAYKIKLADALYPSAVINEKARSFAASVINRKQCFSIVKKRSHSSFGQKFGERTFAGRAMIFAAAKKEVLSKTKGFYPAPLTALKSIRKSYRQNEQKGYRIERKFFTSLAGSPISANLISLFFAGEDLKKAYTTDSALREKAAADPIQTAAVLGAGKMGGGIAWLFSNADIHAIMKDIGWKAVANGFRSVKDIYDGMIKRKRIDARTAGLKTHLISGQTDFTGMQSADFVVEAIVEDLEIKKKTLAEVESVVSDSTIIATNTSSLTMKDLSASMKKPERFVGFHFFNPVDRMPLIEIVRGERTDEQSVYKAVLLARRLGKTPIVVRDTNGFLVNRILMAYLNEAIIMMEEGISFTAIDRAILSFGMPMGPFTLLDEIGIKVGFKVAKVLSHAFPERSPLGKLFAAVGSDNSLLGRSAGKGFYIYKGKKAEPNPAVLKILKDNNIPAKPFSQEEIISRCIMRMLNESVLCLGESIVDTASHLDMALILGIGFPPFRGGLLRYADALGIQSVLKEMKELETRHGQRFTPAPLLITMADKKERFYHEN